MGNILPVDLHHAFGIKPLFPAEVFAVFFDLLSYIFLLKFFHFWLNACIAFELLSLFNH